MDELETSRDLMRALILLELLRRGEGLTLLQQKDLEALESKYNI